MIDPTTNSECGCPCACHGDAEDPGPHLPACLWADESYEPEEPPFANELTRRLFSRASGE